MRVRRRIMLTGMGATQGPVLAQELRAITASEQHGTRSQRVWQIGAAFEDMRAPFQMALQVQRVLLPRFEPRSLSITACQVRGIPAAGTRNLQT